MSPREGGLKFLKFTVAILAEFLIYYTEIVAECSACAREYAAKQTKGNKWIR